MGEKSLQPLTPREHGEEFYRIERADAEA